MPTAAELKAAGLVERLWKQRPAGWDWDHCNACRYAFKKRLDGKIDMDDFRDHKESCPKAPKQGR